MDDIIGENTYNDILYLKYKYKKIGLGLINESSKSLNIIDFNRYPGEQYIPHCSNCSVRYVELKEKIKNNKGLLKQNDQYVLLNHCDCNCLWTAYYKKKITNIIPNAKFVSSKEKYKLEYDVI
jgi:hypothetical protein